MAKMPKPEEMIASRASFPEKSWMDVKTEIKAGMYAYPAKVDIMEGLHMPHPHAWQPEEEDWHLPENWEEIIYKALKERLAKHRSLKIFMDTCVAAPVPTNATSSSAPTIRKICLCCVRNCSVPCTAATSPPPGVSSARLRAPAS